LHALRAPRSAAVALAAAVTGLILLAAAALLLLPTLPDPTTQLAPALLVTLLTALFIEFLIGEDLRAAATP